MGEAILGNIITGVILPALCNENFAYVFLQSIQCRCLRFLKFWESGIYQSDNFFILIKESILRNLIKN